MFKSNKLKSMSDIEKEKRNKVKKSNTNDTTVPVVKSSKTVHIVYVAILVTIAVAIASFISGMNYQKQLISDKDAAVSSALKANTPQNNQ